MLRFLRYIAEIIAGLVGIAVICGLLLAWRLSTRPVSPDFLTPYIITGLESFAPGTKTQIETSSMTWDSHEAILAVHAKNITIRDERNVEVASIPTLDAKISFLGLLFGQMVPKELLIDRPQIKLERNKDGAFTFGDLSVGEKMEEPPSKPADLIAAEFAEHLSHASFMRKMQIADAVLVFHDAESNKDWTVSVPEVSIQRNSFIHFDRTLKHGALDGRIRVEVSQKDADSFLDIYYTFTPEPRQHSFVLTFSNVTPSLVAGGHPEALGVPLASIIDLPLSGKIDLAFDKNRTLVSAKTSIQGGSGRLVYPAFWDTPCPVKSFSISAVFDQKEHALKIADTHVDLEGPILGLNVEGTASSREGMDMDYVASLTIENLPMNKYSDLWPKTVLPNPRDWLKDNIKDGMFAHADVKLTGAFAFDDLANLSLDDGQGKVVALGGRVNYLEGMPPVENVDALASFNLKAMDVQITKGDIGNIRLSPFTIKITGLAEYDQYIDIPLAVSGPIPEILKLLDNKPFQYAKALGIAPQDLEGKIEGTVHFKFPLLKALEMKDVDILATAKGTDVASAKLIPGIPVDGGTVDLKVTPDGFGFEGEVALGKAPFKVVWKENFEEKPNDPVRHVTAVGAIRDNQWENFGTDVFEGTKGPINVSFDMTKPNRNKVLYSGTLDMTPAAVSLPMLAWEKPANVPATLTFRAAAEKDAPVMFSSIQLKGTRVSAKGSAVFSPDMSEVRSFTFSPLILGRTNASLRFEQGQGDGGALKFTATGKSLDISGLRGGNSPDREGPRTKEYTIRVDHLFTGDNGQLDDADVFALRDQEGWKKIHLRGKADKDTPLSLDLAQRPDGTSTFTVDCDSFGKAMKGLGFTDKIKNGKLMVRGHSTIEAPRTIKGLLKITDFTVEKLPLLALLFNAMSPFGITGLLTDSADFSRLRGEFLWTGDSFTFTKAHAASSAVGINIDGKIDMNSSEAHLQGTVVPFSVMNDVLNQIPLIGDLITGGENQGVLAVSYKIDGPLASPTVSVNPISLLTPGFLRNLFFSGDGEEEEEE